MIRPISLPVATMAAATAMSVAVFASIPIEDWKIAGPFGGTATSVALDPERPTTLLAGGTDSLVFQSHDSGDHWDLLNFPRRSMSEATAILVDPNNAKHYFVGTVAANGGGLYESGDSGVTWAVTKDIRDFGVRALAAAPSLPTRFVAGTLRGVMLSDDSGQTWTRISDSQNAEMQGITAVAVDAKDANVIYAGTTHLPWKTLDGGKTWTSIHTGMVDDSDVFSIYVDPSAPASVLASACSGIYASDNRGDAWRKLMGIPNTSRRTHVVRADPANPASIFAGTTTGLFKSPNRGTTWKTLTNAQVNALIFDATHPGSLYLALQYEGLGRSHDDGEAIDPINHGFVDRVVNSVTLSGRRMVAVETQLGETSGLFASEDRGETWMQLKNTRGLGGVHLRTITGLATEERVLLAATPNKLYKSIDSGMTWRPLPVRLVLPPPPPKPVPATRRVATRGKTGTVPRVRAPRPVKPKPIIKEISLSEISSLFALKYGPKELIFATTDLGLLKSDDAGEHWTSADIPGASAINSLFASPVPGGLLIVRGAAGLFASTDGGEHWSAMSFPISAADINEIAIPAEKTTPLLAATRVGLYSSSDGGNTWSSVTGGLPASTVSSVVYSSNTGTAYAVEYGRLFASKDSGASWSAVPSAFSSLSIRQLWIPDQSSARLYGITTDLGILFRN
jgi:photosystem II stability/assembly factor-like uncharacterized protein